MQFEFNRETKARIHLAMLDVLSDDDTHRAYAETCAYAEYPGEVFELARAVEAHVFAKLHGSDFQYVEVTANDLREIHGVETVNWALRLCGVCSRISGNIARWTDAPDREPTLAVTLPASLLEDWCAG